MMCCLSSLAAILEDLQLQLGAEKLSKEMGEDLCTMKSHGLHK